MEFNTYLEATIDYEKVFFYYEKVDVLSLAKVIWKNNSLAQELFKTLLEQANQNDKGIRLFTGHKGVHKIYYFVKGSRLEKILNEIAEKSNLALKLYDFLSSDVYDQVVNYTKMSSVFFEIKSLQENMFKVSNQLATVKGYLEMFPQHRKLVELLES